MPDLLYLIGVPGAGKTTLMAGALEGLEGKFFSQPFSHVQYPGGIMLGGIRGLFGGTDMLSMSVQPKVLEWLKHQPFPAIVGEGDRLANSRFFESVQEYGYNLSVVYLDTPPQIAFYRRELRGTLQDHTWVKGRTTKVAGLASRYVKPRWWLDGRQSAEELVQRLRQHPTMQALAGVPVGTG